MEQSGPIKTARRSFQFFVSHFDTLSHENESQFQYLQTWLEAWLRHGNGFERTDHNPTTYLRVALDIADMAMRKEMIWDFDGTIDNNWEDGYVRAGIVAIHDPAGAAANYADPAWYEAMLAERRG